MANTLAQNTTVVTYSGATSVSASFGVNATNPSLIIAAATQENATGTFSISDNVNAGAYTKDQEIGASNTAENCRVVIARKQSTSAAATTVTCTLGAASTGTLKIYEIAGANTTNAYGTGAANGTDGSAHSITFTPTAANSTIIAVSTHYPGGAVADANYTAGFVEHGGSFAYHFVSHRVDAGAAVSTTLTQGLGSPDYFAFAAASYITAVGGGATVIDLITSSLSITTQQTQNLLQLVLTSASILYLGQTIQSSFLFSLLSSTFNKVGQSIQTSVILTLLSAQLAFIARQIQNSLLIELITASYSFVTRVITITGASIFRVATKLWVGLGLRY